MSRPRWPWRRRGSRSDRRLHGPDRPESDGTFEWDATTLVVVEVSAHGATGLGYTYGPAAVGALVHDLLAPVLADRDPLDVAGAWAAMVAAVRNTGP